MATTTSCTVMLLFHHRVPGTGTSSGREEAGEGDDLFGPLAQGLGVLTP